MTDSFEIKKNTQAFSYTAVVCGLILLLAIFYVWPLQVKPIPVTEDLIEINLGNEREGAGLLQPLVKGDPAPDNKPAYTPVKQAAEENEPAKEIETDDNNDDPEVAPILKPVKTKPEAKNIAKGTTPKVVKETTKEPIAVAVPAPKKPKLPLYKGGTGTGGNAAAQDNGYRNEGYKSGNGDAGSPDGKADSYGSSPGGRSGVSVIRGLSGRRPIQFPSMQDEFNENAKVYVDIKVAASGVVTAAAIAKGTTTSNSVLRSIALQKAKQLKFPPAENEEEAGTILFNFILKS